MRAVNSIAFQVPPDGGHPVTVDAADLTVEGLAAHTVTMTDADTLTFHASSN